MGGHKLTPCSTTCPRPGTAAQHSNSPTQQRQVQSSAARPLLNACSADLPAHSSHPRPRPAGSWLPTRSPCTQQAVRTVLSGCVQQVVCVAQHQQGGHGNHLQSRLPLAQRVDLRVACVCVGWGGGGGGWLETKKARETGGTRKRDREARTVPPTASPPATATTHDCTPTSTANQKHHHHRPPLHSNLTLTAPCAPLPDAAAHSLRADIVISLAITRHTGTAMPSWEMGAGGAVASSTSAVDTLSTWAAAGGRRRGGRVQWQWQWALGAAVRYNGQGAGVHARTCTHIILSATGSRKAPKADDILSCRRGAEGKVAETRGGAGSTSGKEGQQEGNGDARRGKGPM